MSPPEDRLVRLACAVDAVPHHGFLGLRVDEVGGAPVVVLPGEDRHIGDIERRSIHGGVLAAAMEAAARAALEVDGGEPARAVDFTSEFLRAAPVVDTRLPVVIVRRGRRFAQVRVEAWPHDQERPVAVGHGTFALG